VHSVSQGGTALQCFLICWPQLDNPALFPQRYGAPFPQQFEPTVRNMLKRLFRVYAHIYHSHFRCAA